MLCDLVGSTSLSGRLDPEELAEVMRIYQSRIDRVIADLGGYIARYVGDGVLSYFGWPEGEEVSAERAVRAGLAVVSAFESPIRGEKLRTHIGIATGTVVIGEIGSGEARHQAAVGETPNLAARLQQLAAPDCVVIDDATRRHIGGLFTCQDLGEVALKGFRLPVRAWRVMEERTVADRFAALRASRLVPLVDREDELALTLHRWRQAASGNGQLVMLKGEPGIGKSRLILELRAGLASEPHGSLRYFCSPHHQANPLYPVIARLEYEARFGRGDAPNVKLRKLETLLEASDAPAEDIALIADLLGVPVGEAYPLLNLSPQGRKQKTFEALVGRVVALARQRPLLMLAEDVHWADPSSLELLDRIVERLSALPVLLVVSFRPEFAPPWVGPNATLVTLNRLGRRDAEQLASEVMIGQALPPALLDRIVARSDGVPLFIEELTKSVVESGADDPTSLPSLAVPESLQALLTARLDRLPAAKRVAQIGATIGREFAQSLLAAVGQLTKEQLAAGLDELVSSGLASRRRELTDPVYTFKHALVQEAIYESLLRRRRADLHGAIVAAAESDASLGVTEPGLLGYHCAQAGLLAKAASYYRIAGGRSAERAAVAETRIYLERGLRFAGNLPEGPDRHRLEAELLIALGRILMATKGPNDPEAGAAFRRGVDVCRKLNSPEMLARALYSLAITAETRAELRVAQAIGEELQGLGTASGDAGIAIAALVRLGCVEYYRGHFVAACDHHRKALALWASGEHQLRDSAISANPHLVAEAHLSAAFAHMGCVKQAIARGKSAVEKARKAGASSPAYALVLSVWWRTLEVLRDEAGCAEYATMLLALGEEQGFSFLRAAGQCQLGWVTAKQGDIDKGLRLVSEGVASLKALGAVIQPEVGKYLYSDVLALAGQRTEALATLEEVLAFSRGTHACWLDAELHRKKGELLLAGTNADAADAAQAEQEFRRAIDIARDQAAKLFELRAVTSLARLWSVRGKRTAALELLRTMCAHFGEGADIPDVREAKALLSVLELGLART